jgi:ABC-type Mn2+/Zn2+ transport system permease subunit
MSLRAFHLVFIAASVVLAAFFAAWAAGEYHTTHDASYALVAVASLASGVGIAVYGTLFQRKTKRLVTHA